MRGKSYSDLLDIQVRCFQLGLPSSVNYRKREVDIVGDTSEAARRAIWFIIKKGYGVSTALSATSGSFDFNPTVVERAVRAAFPEGYFSNYNDAKSSCFARKMFNASANRGQAARRSY